MNRPPPSLGIVGLDTTHATAWVRLLQARGARIAIHDQGAVWPREAVLQYCRHHSLKFCETLAELADTTEIVAIMNCDWDQHISCAAPFVAAGKTVYIDKPVAVTDQDLATLSRWSGKPLILGSCNRYEPHLLEWRRSRPEQLSSFTSQRAEFYHAIHAVETGQTVVGTGARRVRWLADQSGCRFEIEHDQVRSWIAGCDHSLQGLEVARQTGDQKELLQFPPGGNLQNALIDEVVRVHHGVPALISVAEAIEAVRILRAAWTSREQGNRWIGCVEPEQLTISGSEFARSYRLENQRSL